MPVHLPDCTGFFSDPSSSRFGNFNKKQNAENSATSQPLEGEKQPGYVAFNATNRQRLSALCDQIMRDVRGRGAFGL